MPKIAVYIFIAQEILKHKFESYLSQLHSFTVLPDILHSISRINSKNCQNILTFNSAP